jgi:hypothetical protein
MITYKEFLEKANIISEELFNDIIRTLPDVDIEEVNFLDIYELDSQDEIASELIATILNKWDCATCSDVNFERRTFCVDDVQSEKDLKEINATLSNWIITNYEEALEWCKENEKSEKEDEEREQILRDLRYNASIEQLREFRKSIN